MKRSFISPKYLIIGLAHLGMFLIYASRVSLSVTLVAMVNATYAHADPKMDPECKTSGTNVTAPINNGEFDWNQSQQGILLSSFFYGYMITQIPGGWLTLKFGGKKVMGFSVLITCVLTLLTPLAARLHIACFIAVRVLEGLSQGGVFPAINYLISRWVPQSDITLLSAMVFGGIQSGTVVALSTSGFLADSSFLGGWPSPFYLYGSLGLLWCMLWFALVYDSPDQHPYISEEKKQRLKTGIKSFSTSDEKLYVPWKSIMTSLPVWAIIFGCFSDAWVWNMALTGLPSYFKQVLDFKIEEDGLLSAAPYLMSFVLYLLVGFISDYLRKRYLSTTATRKLMASLVYYPMIGCLLGVSYTGCDNKTLSVMLMILSVAILSMNQASVSVNQLDLSPTYCSILAGITNASASLAGCLSPLVTGYFTNDKPTRAQYRKVFIVAAIVSFVGGTFCVVFMSGKIQEWNHNHAVESKNKPCTNGNEDTEHDEQCVVNSRDTDHLIKT